MNFQKSIAAAGIVAASMLFAGASWADASLEKLCAKPGPAMCNPHCPGSTPDDPECTDEIASNPEIDGSQAGIALALILGIGLLVSERRRKTAA